MLYSIIQRGVMVLFVSGSMLGSTPALAQTPPVPSNVQNQPAPTSALAPPATPVSGSAAPSGAPAVTPLTGANASSSIGKSFGSAGNGLPGMPGGPPINGALGAQDPSGKYMRPPVVPPVLCDPAVDLPC